LEFLGGFICLVCKDWQKGKLTAEEAIRNLSEMLNSEDGTEEDVYHYFEAAAIISDEEDGKTK
jgi:hypothetical protein